MAVPPLEPLTLEEIRQNLCRVRVHDGRSYAGLRFNLEAGATPARTEVLLRSLFEIAEHRYEVDLRHATLEFAGPPS